ncbi:recombinase XerC [Geobacillus sp. MR]|uniref:tyrosine-type recombinase/integrase n=1 Tax=Geobacillus sp. MR TaxID=2508875 RepID=UPI00148D15F8|nr:tyrosine-type recombinase/integrase [Geobacillus sp. MR]NNU88684.1 recombinase XerC [Geobacillus sp. MR]
MKKVAYKYDELIGYLKANGKSDNTIKSYIAALSKFDEWLNEREGSLADLTRYDVQSYIKALEQAGKKASTINSVFAAIRVYCRFLGREELIGNISVPKQQSVLNIAPKSLEENELARVLRQVEKDARKLDGSYKKTGLRDLAIVYTLLYTGVRVSELVALNVADVELSDRKGTLFVRKGKGDKAREIPLAREVRHYLREYLASRNDDNEALFVSNYGERIAVRTVQHLLAKYDIHPHLLRHTFIRKLVSEGVDIATAADLAGHNDINVTRRYSKPTPSDLRKAIEKAFS